ncbi:oxidoreductase [Flavobacterium akiainvivens]|uniref:Oxidoreductase n=1 Tax=Flavobacterium akiainvivens TaxID=1202724 RepID=A0A0M9VJ88_9FLAO|nr:SDR family oxidoreductase [Flavobacterium akiainvivens]KOS07516.1 oxidoreductase [Flavobacterium akiainvivens]SFQ63896.1 NAD(P)-dependent dehydrogenase, short-chain alcohol dehydrogenase family [Flavobacterium akiainvivens]
MNLNLEHKKAFISGSTQGIGYAIAQQLLAEGAEVTINGRDIYKTGTAVDALKKQFPESVVKGIAADFSNIDEVNNLLSQIDDIDILINNVGIFELKDFEAINDDDWYKIFDINVMSSVRLSRHIMAGLLKKKWGRILFISSESGVNVPGNMIHYGMTKAAMMALSNGLSKLTRGTQVTVNTILGGPTYSTGVAATIKALATAQGIDVEQMKQGIITHTNPDSLLQRFINPEEIAHLVTYLASPLSSATNGACLRADGGVLRTV